MLTATHHALTLRALARVLAAWLVAIVCVQGWAAAEGLVRGSLHVHAAASSQAQAPQAHEHGDWQRHLHAHDGTGVVSADADAGGGLSVGGLLALSLAAALFVPWRAFAAAGADALPDGGRSDFRSHHPLPLDRPPRG
jgi:hypothetical protein